MYYSNKNSSSNDSNNSINSSNENSSKNNGDNKNTINGKNIQNNSLLRQQWKPVDFWLKANTSRPQSEALEEVSHTLNPQLENTE